MIHVAAIATETTGIHTDLNKGIHASTSTIVQK